MPEVPQEIPEKKTCVVPHKKPEGPHDEGICCWKLRDLGKCLFLYKCVSCVYWLLLTPKCKNINIFKVPEAPKEVVPEKKMHPPPKPAVVSVKGTFLTSLQCGIGDTNRKNYLASQPWKFFWCVNVIPVCVNPCDSSVNLLISSKCLKLPKRLSLRRKCEWCLLNNPKFHLSQVFVIGSGLRRYIHWLLKIFCSSGLITLDYNFTNIF